MTGCKIGNPAPLGLLCFGMTTMMLMYIDMGWVESDFEEMVAGYALFYGGAIQTLVAIFELLKGASYSFAVFGSYGAFWLGWAMTVYQTENNNMQFTGDYVDGKTFYLAQWGVLTFCFWIIALRKNMCLTVVLGLLVITFFLLAAATQTGDAATKKAAGYFGFATAVGAWYTAVAELVNEEYGYLLLPGLAPMLKPEQFEITKESIAKRCEYDKKSNTLFLQFRGIQVKTAHDITAIKQGLQDAFAVAKDASGKAKSHVIVDYDQVHISAELYDDYWAMAADLERNYYLSVKRFHVSSFGTGNSSTVSTHGMRKLADGPPSVKVTGSIPGEAPALEKEDA